MISFGRPIDSDAVSDRLRIDLGRQLHAKALPLAPRDPAMGRPAVGQEDDHALSHGEFAVAPPAQAHFRNVADQYVDLTMIWMTHTCLQQSALAIMKPLGSKIGIRNGHSVPYLFNMVPRRTFGDLRFRSTWPKEPYDVQSRPLGAP